MRKLFSVFLLLIASEVSLAADIPDFSANYAVKLNGIQAGELKRTLETDQTGLRHFTSISQAKGVFSFFKPDIIEETSLWRLKDNVVQPQFYRYLRTGGKKEKRLEMKFNWLDMTAQIDDREHPWQLDIEPNTLDKLVYQISLMRDLIKHKGDQITYRIADGGKLKTYQIRILGEERIKTPMGEIDAVKLTRHRDKDNERETTLWCAPSLAYLPVKLEHIEDGTTFTAVLRRLKGMDYEQAFIHHNNTSTIDSHD